MVGIYKFENKINGKVYIGQSIDIENRYKGHIKAVKAGDNTHFHNALRKYGIDNFKFDILIECPKENLDYWEKFYIKYYCSYELGYNQTKGGEGVQLFKEKNGMYGRHHSDESKKKMSLKRRGKPLTEEHKQKLIDYYKTHDHPRKGKHCSEESKEKNRKAHLGKKMPKEFGTKLSNIFKEYYKTHESKLKGKPTWNSGKEQKSHMTEESIERCRESGRINGTRLWIYKENLQKRCFPDELEYYINLGYKRGRIKYTC